MSFYSKYVTWGWILVVAVITACTPAADTSSESASDITIAVVTHGGVGDSFWDVVKGGSEQAGADLGITVQFQSNGDPAEQARLIQTAVAQSVDGLVVSMANPDAVESSVRQAVDRGIPVISINSGLAKYKEFGTMTHVGQTEFIAGQGAGERFVAAGVKNLLIPIQEQGNIALEERADGAGEVVIAAGGTVERFYITGTSDVAASLAEVQAKLQANPDVDGVLSLSPVIALVARDAVRGAQSSAIVGTFDLNGDVIDAIEAGEILFAIDQQPFLQGYLPVVFLYLNVINENATGGGLPILTGPGFVDAGNAAAVKALAAAGTR